MRELLKIQRAAVVAAKHMRETGIVDDDFDEMRERCDLAISRADDAWKKHKKKEKRS
jgi:hypothetical protein